MKILFEITLLSLDNGFLVCILLSSQNPTSEKQHAFPEFLCALRSPFKRPNPPPKVSGVSNYLMDSIHKTISLEMDASFCYLSRPPRKL